MVLGWGAFHALAGWVARGLGNLMGYPPRRGSGGPSGAARLEYLDRMELGQPADEDCFTKRPDVERSGSIPIPDHTESPDLSTIESIYAESPPTNRKKRHNRKKHRVSRRHSLATVAAGDRRHSLAAVANVPQGPHGRLRAGRHSISSIRYIQGASISIT